MFDNLEARLDLWWDNVKAWFKRSETIFLARMGTFFGFITAAIAGVDWNGLLTTGVATGMEMNTAVYMGIQAMLVGILTEIGRRRNTKEIEGHLVPTAEALPVDVAPLKKTKKAKKKV